MRKRNRSYKKGAPHRDARLFVIVAEGDREDKYFNHFDQRTSRIRVLTIPREQDASAPKHFIGRLENAKVTGEYDPEDEDEVWFVCDTDRWGSQINDLKLNCSQKSNWNLAVSNPCFEVWLHFHSGPIVSDLLANCGELKTQLPGRSLGGFNKDVYCLHIETAITHAANADQDPNSDFPGSMQTKVYKLAKRMCEVLGSNWR